MAKVKSRRVLVLVHPKFRPDTARAKNTETDVWHALKTLGHAVEVAALDTDWRGFDRQLVEARPDIVFNLLEEFRGEGIFDFHPVTHLEALGIPFTGCNPRGLALTRNKLWTMQLARAEGCLVPDSQLLPAGRMKFPLFLKFNREHASFAVTQANIVRSPVELKRTVRRLRARFGGEILAQSFIEGLELSVSVCGNQSPRAFAPWRLCLPSARDVATTTVKFSAAFRRRRKIRAVRFRDPVVAASLQKTSLRLFRHLDMNGYARFDYRLSADGRAFLIDVNANPSLARTEDFAVSALHHGLAYYELIDQLVRLGLRYSPFF